MRRRSIALNLAALLLVTATIAGCAPAASLDPDREALATGPRSALRIVLSAPAGVRPAVETTLVDALGERRIGAGELRASADLPSPHSGWQRVADRGTLTVRVAVSAGRGEPLGVGSVALPLDAGGLWSVEALVFRPAPGIPAPPCLGCEAETRVPLRPSAAAGTMSGDSLFLRATRMPAAGRAPLPPS